MRRHSILPVQTLSADTQKFFDVLNDEPDFSVVVVACAYLDACLGSILKNYLLESKISMKLLDARSGALGALGARTDACYSLGLIPKRIYQDLLVLAEIRNHVAHHHLTLTFASPELAEGCKSLKYAEMLERWDRDDGELMFKPGQLNDTRTRFVMTVVLLSQRLLLIALEVKRVNSVT